MKKAWIIIAVVSLSSLALMTSLIFSESHFGSAAETVSDYWRFCLNEDFESANKIKSETSVHSPMSEKTALGNKSVSTGISADIINSDGKIEDCCFSKEIAERKLKITKIVEEKKDGLNARVVVEAENEDKHKENYVNCLIDKNSEWIIISVALSSQDSNLTNNCFSQSYKEK